jgi:hypothetical protein
VKKNNDQEIEEDPGWAARASTIAFDDLNMTYAV